MVLTSAVFSAVLAKHVLPKVLRSHSPQPGNLRLGIADVINEMSGSASRPFACGVGCRTFCSGRGRRKTREGDNKNGMISQNDEGMGGAAGAL